MSRFCSWAICIGALLATCEGALAQVCKPVAERNSELGCWIIAAEPVGNLSKSEAFWHLDVYLTSAAAKLAKTPSSAGRWGTRCGNRPAASGRRGDLRGAVYGGRFRARNDCTLSHPCGARRLVHTMEC